MRSLVSIFLFCLIFTACGFDKNEYKNYQRNLPELIDSLGIPKNNLSILIDKSDYCLSILSDSIVVKQYPVVFGGNPVDDKRMQGDQCTPEGEFYIISKYPHKNWSKFIWINYPNDESRRKFNEARAAGVIPDDADIGGEIGIHGVPKGMESLIDIGHNWTLGCISLKNADVDEIFPYINEKTKIVIQK